MQMTKTDLINALNGLTVDEKTVKKADMIETLEAIFSTAEGMAAVKQANTDLARDRETLKGERATLKAQITEMETKIKTLESKGGDSVKVAELEAVLNRTKSDLDALKTETAAEKTARLSAEATVREERLRSSLLTEATAMKARKPAKVAVLMKSDGLVEINEKGETVFYRINAGRKEAASANEAVKAYLEANPEEIEPSGNNGSGSDHGGGSAEKSFDRVAALGKGK